MARISDGSHLEDKTTEKKEIFKKYLKSVIVRILLLL
jgi:hypothetical protein